MARITITVNEESGQNTTDGLEESSATVRLQVDDALLDNPAALRLKIREMFLGTRHALERPGRT